MDEINFIIDSTEESMQKAITHLEKELIKIRAGKANPNMVSSVLVEYYGSKTPLNQVGNINTPDARTISIQPFEKSLIPEIEKGIQKANLGFNPMNNGESVIISVPPLTEERRKELAKQAKAVAEEAKVGVRNDRKSAMNEIKKLEDASDDLKKNAEVDVQALTDKYIAKIDTVLTHKEKEIMTV
ncbi:MULTISPECIES: ribosome recycling factor [Mesonia]|uniref:Ribosome-recycling factor n=1 Tax=Mesonia oceanica TaxID=2687242 RepID=A0AC61Y885_9FLAO|nr:MULTISPECIES: ribosome recycling factor [Mesonia]MBJ97165.1 ribosome recycling factor [Flavobacteriaceae bacterium]MAN25840.1 ribosome recycling factor [Mesonia sp.]MAN27650.1 ribosome recycling factor [Mesonia sp.]MAQ40255.1 ribosome recycling factor [Mesonia sp.]VVV00682.1 Ribosome-recycling factor [Mesonia oceanica]|tara:strand:- start:12999 stop:13553 length:555 start_codon:yes stop_codon:yes gene_type:complete